MRQFRFDYSLKKIPIRSQDAYLRNLIEKVESVLKRMRWKAHFFLKGDEISDQNNPFGLPSNKTPPTILEIKSFENNVINLIENIKFKNVENQFQISLVNDLKKIHLSPKIFVFADKTIENFGFYSMSNILDNYAHELLFPDKVMVVFVEIQDNISLVGL